MTSNPSYLVLLPTQLFEKIYVKRVLNRFESLTTIVLYEHRHYFSKYAYNKKKLLLHKASMDYYYGYLKQHFRDYKILYVDIDDSTTIQKMASWHTLMFNPIDVIDLSGNIIIIDSPAFLLTDY